jgi:sodium/hydrogen antiporter
MWASTALGAHLLLGLGLLPALLLGAVLTPTDPVVASTLVEGPIAKRNLPRWLRRSLQLESGANDGLALVFVLVPLLAIAWPGASAAAVVAEAGKQVALAVVLGAGIGAATGWVVDRVEAGEDASTGFLLISALAMGLLALGAVHGLGGTGVLGSFVAGVTFGLTVRRRDAERLEEVQNAFERLLVVPVFLLLGALLPFSGWAQLGWGGAGFALWVLLVRRPLPTALALAPTGTPTGGQVFLGWYGPLGVAALYYLAFVDRWGLTEYDRLFAAGTLAVATSVLAHSVTATPGVRAYGRRRRSTGAA